MAVSEHFSEEELACRCGCGVNGVRPEFIAFLEEVREHLGRPMIINSAYRCPRHDSSPAIGGKGNHPQGLAVDLRCGDMRYRLQLVSSLIACGCRRIEIAERYVHADLVRDRPEGMWLHPDLIK